MRIISFIILGISLFLIGVASYFIVTDEKKKHKARADQLSQAREAKLMKAKQRNEPYIKELEELENNILENGTEEKEKIDN